MNGATKRDAIRERLEELAKFGRLTPEQVVEDATDPSSPLHGEFEWSDDEAARKYRLHQARQIITTVKVQIRTDSRIVAVPAYVRDPKAATREQGYVRVATLKTDEQVAREALLNEVDRAMRHVQRVRNLAAVLGMEADIEDMLERFGVMREELLAA